MADDPTPEDLEDALLVDAIEGVQSVTIGDETVTAMRIQDRIAALNELRKESVTSRPHRGLFRTQLVPGGCG